MAVRAMFYGGPLDYTWKAMQEPMSEIKVAKSLPVDVDPVSTPAEFKRVTGSYVPIGSTDLGDGDLEMYYRWRGWEDDLQEVQESKGEGIER